MNFPTLLEVVATDPKRDRAPVARGFCEFEALKTRLPELKTRVDREGGKYDSGVIYGVSIITRGEALGHDQWIDEETLDQTVKLSKSESKAGLKMRFTHPSMSGDGLGTFIGRAVNLYREGDQVFGDVHLSKTSRKTPDGDLGAYVMDLAENDPEMFGTSIVFDHDREAEEMFMEEHQQEVEYKDYRGREIKEFQFRSPDSDNVNNFPHIRLASLYAADFVDEPAANPSGLFHRGPTHDVLTQAEGLIEYVLGLSDQVPKETGGLSAERLKGFLSRFLDGRGMVLSVSSKEQAMKKSDKLNEGAEGAAPEEATETPETAQEASETPSETQETSEGAEGSEEASESLSKADAKKFVEKFGAEKGMKYLLDGTSFEEALSIEFDALKAKETITAGLERGEEKPVGTNFSEGKKANGVLPKGVESFANDVIKMPSSRAGAN